MRPSGDAPAQEFFERDCEGIREKGKNHPEATARARFALLFQQMANHGSVSYKRFKKEMGALYAFRHEVKKLQIRFPCFPDGNRWILTHGFIKPGAKKKLGDWPESEVRRANEIMAEYLQRKSSAANGAGRGNKS
ncbi:MAG TPA: hypothetical protein VGF55_21745 [Gemmataceae bacterium]